MLSCTTGSQRKKMPTEAETAPSALDLFSLFPQVQGFRLSCVLCHLLSRPRNIIILACKVPCLLIALNKRYQFDFPFGPHYQKTNLTLFLKRPFSYFDRKLRIINGHHSSRPDSFRGILKTLAGRDHACRASSSPIASGTTALSKDERENGSTCERCCTAPRWICKNRLQERCCAGRSAKDGMFIVRDDRQHTPAIVAIILIVCLCLLVACGGGSSLTPALGWTQVTGSGPSPRWGHSAVLDSVRQDAVLFGGAGGGSEVWIFSFRTRSWARVDAPNGPSPRWSPAAVPDPNHDRMVVVGGVTSAATDEVWAFSFANHTWSQLPKGPSPRFDMGATTDGTHAWFYGGFLAGSQATDELWQFDLTSDTWALLLQPQVRPSPRTNMGIGLNNGALYVVGGHDAIGLTPGTWQYQFSLQTWTELSPTGISSAGAHFASATDGSCRALFLAGGDHDDNIDVNTTDVFSFTQPSFQRLHTIMDFVPSRRHSVLVLEPQSRTLMLFGGIHDPSQVLGDTWIYDLGGCPQ